MFCFAPGDPACTGPPPAGGGAGGGAPGGPAGGIGFAGAGALTPDIIIVPLNFPPLPPPGPAAPPAGFSSVPQDTHFDA